MSFKTISNKQEMMIFNSKNNALFLVREKRRKIEEGALILIAVYFLNWVVGMNV